MEWREAARCRDSLEANQLAYSEQSGGDAARTFIRRYCNLCGVSSECLRAGRTERWGVWGGVSAVSRIKFFRLAATITGRLKDHTVDAPEV